MVVFQHSKSSVLALNGEDFVFLDSACYSNVSRLTGTVIFSFRSPLYFATLTLFKRQLFAASISLSELRARQKLPEKQHQKNLVEVSVVEKSADGKAGTEITTDCDRNRKSSMECTTADCDGRIGRILVEKSGDGKADMETTTTECDSGNGQVGEGMDFGDSFPPTVAVAENNGKSLINGRDGSSKADVISNIILECGAVAFIDTAGCQLLGQLHVDYAKLGVHLMLAGCCDSMVSSLKRADQCQQLCQDDLYPSVQSAVLCLHSELY